MHTLYTYIYYIAFIIYIYYIRADPLRELRGILANRPNNTNTPNISIRPNDLVHNINRSIISSRDRLHNRGDT